MKTVNFGIDLGTTNSLIAKYEDGAIEVYKNPMGQKQTLSSAVAFRGERILVGDKARNLMEKDPLNVFTCFKRRMGTTDEYFSESLQKKITPIELSSYVLKELKNFVHTGENINEVVITIPSSFDTIQSNATKTAGIMAGFSKVFLLQEPIAASLAFANKNDLHIEGNKKWLVYDYGGGTFDVALLEVTNRAMNVLDNEGDNFLGGMDFDSLIVEKLIVPSLEIKLKETKLWEQFKTPGNAFQKVYYELLFKAEEAKKELSRFEETEIEIDIPELGFYESFLIKTQDFNALIAPSVDKTIFLASKILQNNGCLATDIEKIVMVGGSTLIPFVRERVSKELKIEIDTSVEPTSAVGVGAAYYAGTKILSNTITPKETIAEKSKEDIYQVYYEKNTKDLEVLISVKINSPENQGFYRIIRNDGGFDTGLVQFKESINCFVDVLTGEKNDFNLKIFDKAQSQKFENRSISIIQGKYDIEGQLLPNDICLEIDDIDHGVTRLEAIFKKNAVLPLKRTVYKTATKNVLLGSEDTLKINIVEGDDNGLPSSGLSIGYIEISGSDLEQDLIKGTDIEIELTISESRDIDVNVFLNTCNQEFRNIFRPTERYISVSKMNHEINTIVKKIEAEFKKHKEDYELLAKFKKIRDALIELQIEITLIQENDTTDIKFKIDNSKRLLVKEFDQMTRYKELNEAINEHLELLSQIQRVIATKDDDFYQKKLDGIIANNFEYLNSGNKFLIKSKIKELEELNNALFKEDDANFIGVFLSYKGYSEVYENPKKAYILIQEGDKALSNKQYEVVKHVVYQLHALLPKEMRNSEEPKPFKDDDKTGLK